MAIIVVLVGAAVPARSAAQAPAARTVRAKPACVKREVRRLRHSHWARRHRAQLRRHPATLRRRAHRHCLALARHAAAKESRSTSKPKKEQPAPTPTPTPTPAPTPPPPPPPSTALKFGINANTIGYGLNAGAEQDRVLPLGVGWLREEIDWPDVEPQPGTWSWSVTDALFTAAAKRGLHVLPLLAKTPGWTGSADPWAIPADPSGFAGFVRQVVARYGNGGSFWAAHPELTALPATTWEIWNEPYIPPFSGGAASPAAYARLFRAAAIGARAADPQAKLLIEADTTGTSDWHEYHPWVDAMYAAVPDLGSYFDGIAVHPYGEQGPDYYTPPNTRWEVRRLQEIYASFSAHGDGAKHLWVTEFGWTTCPGGTEGCVSEATQASFLKRFLDLAETTWRPYMDAVFVYGFHEWESSPTDPEDWYGLARTDWTHKPAWDVYRSYATAATS